MRGVGIVKGTEELTEWSDTSGASDGSQQETGQPDQTAGYATGSQTEKRATDTRCFHSPRSWGGLLGRGSAGGWQLLRERDVDREI